MLVSENVQPKEYEPSSAEFTALLDHIDALVRLADRAYDAAFDSLFPECVDYLLDAEQASQRAKFLAEEIREKALS